MIAPRALRTLVLAATVAALAASCARDCPPPSGGSAGRTLPTDAPAPLFTCRDGGATRAARPHPARDTAAHATALLDADADATAAGAARDAWQGRTFDEYLQSLRRECDANGKYLVDGDVAISDIKLLREFFEDRIQRTPAEPPMLVWTTQQKRALTYCVSTAFGVRHDQVVADMEAATGAWEQVANVDFDHVAAQDASCSARNDAVIFDVNPVDVGGAYLARAFVPGEPRAGRNVYVDLGALALDPAQDLQLSGVLRHELGHALGFRHEHVRPASGACFEDAARRVTAPGEVPPVMHYPPCDGGAGWKLLLSYRDQNIAACTYGAAPGFSIDPAVCAEHLPPVPPPDTPRVQRFPGEAIARGMAKEYAVLTAKPGSLVRVAMHPQGARPGDPDLYVRLGGKPAVQPAAFTCRPFLTGALETCELNAGAAPNNLVRILVHGTTAGSYDLEVSYVPLTP